ncbi:MAG: peroxidase-related enzyme [Chitinophagaceae bacterium]|nr:peroxidase-related enzyme [Anaerolineae bacterium]
MSFIETVPKTDATGTVKEIYEAAEERSGYVPNYIQLFSHRPEVYQAWQNLLMSIRKNMRLRRYELVTLAAARQLECSYCMLAHGDVLLTSGEVDEAQLAAIAQDYHHARLAPDEVAVMEFAEKIITKASSVTQADVDHLKSFGISDAEILDITLATAARSFFSKTLDALNAEPDAKYMGLDSALRSILTVGRPFGDTEKTSAIG